MSELIEQFKANLNRWEDELQEARGTLVVGIASKSVNTLDEMMRELLGFYLRICGLEYDEKLKPLVGKKLEQITMGQTKECFERLNRELTQHCRKLSPDIAKTLRKRRLLPMPLKEKLDRVLGIRTDLYHHISKFSNETLLKKETLKLIHQIKPLLDDAFFQIPVLWACSKSD